MYKNGNITALKTIIKLCYVGLAVVTVGMWIVRIVDAQLISAIIKDYFAALIPFTFVVPAGYIALAYIEKLLTNVSENRVFESTTTKYLNIICYCCVYAAVVGVVSVVVSLALKINSFVILISVLTLGELFMALLLKVIKSVFAKAIEIKEENDLTV